MRTLVLSLLFFSQTAIQAQQQIIKGVLLDRNSSAPIPFAHIALLGSNKGTVSNADGVFHLKNISSAEVLLKVSCIGYGTDTVKWERDKHDRDFKIQLFPAILQLEDIYVNGERTTPQEIIEEAYLRINENYWLEPHLLTGYFKETESTNGKAIYQADAIIQAKIPGKGRDADGRIEILHLSDRMKKMPEYENWRREFRKRNGISGGAYRCLKYSINDPINAIFPSHFQDYSYRIEGYTNFNGKKVVIISFTDSKRKPIFGKLIIDLASYAFVRIEGSKTHGDGGPLDNWKWSLHTWVEQYMEDENGKWLLNSSIYIGDWIQKRNKFYWLGTEKNQKYQTRSYYFTTDYAKSKAFTEQGIRFERNEIMIDRAFNNDHSYWENFDHLILRETEKEISKQVEIDKERP
ncbi:MAG: carboxypeptidase-like regulatory domain-containing protein [Ekhidna sp.]